MKKLFFTILAVIIMGMTTSCSTEDEDQVISEINDPESGGRGSVHFPDGVSASE